MRFRPRFIKKKKKSQKGNKTDCLLWGRNTDLWMLNPQILKLKNETKKKMWQV